MKKLACLIMSAVLVMCLCISCYAGNDADDRAKRFFGTEEHLKYTLYIGLNAYDTGKPTYPVAEAKKIFTEIADKFISGCTLYEADGYWRDGDKVYKEHTLVCVIVDEKPEIIKKVMDAAIEAFRQSSILIEINETDSAFYTGK